MKAVRVVGWVMIWSGGLILAFLGYQLFVTNLRTASEQATATEELSDYFAEGRESLAISGAALPPSLVADSVTPEVPTDTETDAEPVLYEEVAEPVAGVPVAQIFIETADVDHVVVEGVDRASLRKGPGHMPWTPLPGQPGNAVISGHRTTYGAPFYNLDAVQLGDEIVVETIIGRHVYEVRSVTVVEPTAVEVTDPLPGAWLTLTTCHPRLSARQRLVVAAELISGPNYEFAQSITEAIEESAA